MKHKQMDLSSSTTSLYCRLCCKDGKRKATRLSRTRDLFIMRRCITSIISRQYVIDYNNHEKSTRGDVNESPIHKGLTDGRDRAKDRQ
jgi:hypothetical protein